MKDIKVFGIDLAKNVFQVHGTDARGKRLISKKMSRAKLIEFITKAPPAIIGIEACGGAHYWARYFRECGHEVRIMSPQFVKPYVKSNKNDRNDAEAIAEACMRPNMRFVAVKTIAQQDLLSIHRAREMSIKIRTGVSNQIRGLLNEYGVVIPEGISKIRQLFQMIDEHRNKLSSATLELITNIHDQFKFCDEQVKSYDKQLNHLAEQNGIYKEIQEIPGIGPITATAIVATIGDAKLFKNGREVAAWLGLVPKQFSSGDKTVLGGISKRGDSYIRKLLIQGARTVVKKCEVKTDKLNQWVAKKKQRGGYNKAAVALANKNARTIWAMMATGECYRQPVLN
jgi:transposase